MNWEEERLLYRIAKMYYEDQMTQKEISDETGIYRTTVGRLIKKAYKKGIVKIEIKSSYSDQFLLEEKIANHFNLKEVIIVDGSDALIADSTFGLLDRILTDDDVLGVSWGSTVGEISNQSRVLPPKDITCVPLVGGAGKMDVEFHVNAIAHNFANAFKAKAKFIDAAAVYETQATADEILHSDFMQKILTLWDKLTVAVVGIGAIKSSSNMVWSGFMGEKEQIELQEHQAVGDILSRFYKEDGEIINSSIANRTVALDLEKLKSLKYSIGVAYTKEKVDSIIAAMRGQYINVLITDLDTALEIENKI